LQSITKTIFYLTWTASPHRDHCRAPIAIPKQQFKSYIKFPAKRDVILSQRVLRVLWCRRCDNKRYSLSHLCPQFWCLLWINCVYQTTTFPREKGPARYSQVLNDRFAHPNNFFQRLEFNLLWTLGHFDRSHSVLPASWQAVCEPWINIVEGSITKQFICIQ